MESGPSILTVSYPVRPGEEKSFHEWLSKLNQSAIGAEGFLGMGSDALQERPAETEWKITYKFDSTRALNAWMTSAPRKQAHAEGVRLFTSAPQETLGSTGGRSRSLMVVSSHVPPDRVTSWQSGSAAFNAAVSKFPGFDGLDIFKPLDGSDVWTTVLSFHTEQDLERWKQSPEREALLEHIDSARQDEVRVERSAFGQWFSANATPSSRTPAWKEGMVVLLALFPLVTVYDMTLGNAAGRGLNVAGHPVFSGLGLPFPAVVFLGNAVGTVLLTWAIMPAIVRAFGWWLDPFATRSQTLRGSVMLIFLYAIEIAVAIFIYRTWGF